MTKPQILWLILDGKPGHENQSLGLADALMRKISCETYPISIAGAPRWVSRIRSAVQKSAALPRPDFIIAAGHATHLPLLWLTRKYQAKSVVLMRPSLPTSFFDFCIVPHHDFVSSTLRENVILTRGALNRVEVSEEKKAGKLILIGGPSKTHGWNGAKLLESLSSISKSGQWALTDSRRTPKGFIDEIRKNLPQIECFPNQKTEPTWLPERLRNSDEVWVTEDSVSMIYEALSSGAAVGLLPVPRLAKKSRTLVGLERLVEDHYVTALSLWEKTHNLPKPPEILREADRCADWMVKRKRIFFR